MHVLHWFPNFSAGGGVANSVYSLGAAQSAVGADVSIVSLPHDDPVYGPLASNPELALTRWEGTAFGHGRMGLHVPSRATRRELRELGPDIVHIHAEFNPDNWWPPRLWSCPIVLSPHGAFHSAVVERRARRKASYIAVARRALYRRVSRFHALSPAEQSDIVGALPTARTYVVPQGPSPAVTKLLSENTGVAAADLKDDQSRPVRLLFLGRIDVQVKGLDILVEALARAFHEGGDERAATLTLVGPDRGQGAARLRALAAGLGVGHLVEIREHVPQAEIPALLQDCDVYVQLSRNEGSPLSLNDALALGKPAIVSNRIGTISCDEIKTLAHVVAVEPTPTEAARAITDVLTNVGNLRRLAHEAHPRVRAFLSWERAADRHLELYSALVTERRA